VAHAGPHVPNGRRGAARAHAEWRAIADDRAARDERAAVELEGAPVGIGGDLQAPSLKPAGTVVGVSTDEELPGSVGNAPVERGERGRIRAGGRGTGHGFTGRIIGG